MNSSRQESLSISQWISEHKGITFSLAFGIIFVSMEVLAIIGYETTTSGPMLIMMETVLLIIIFLGMMIFIYNFGYMVIMLTVDEGLNDEEVVLLKWILRRSVLISVGWFIGVIVLMLSLSGQPYLLAGMNCFLLAFLFFILRKGENPLVEGVSI
jgi:hypothetical protein